MKLVIGCGSLLRGDDGIGQIAAAQIAAGNLPDDVVVIAQTQLTPELVEIISRAQKVIFIDASVVGSPGEIACHELKATANVSALVHFASPEMLLSVAYDLYGASPTGYLVSMVGETFGFSHTLSPLVLQRLPLLIECVRRLLI